MKNRKETIRNDINLLISWLLTEFDIDVIFEPIKEGGNSFYPETKLISINNRTNLYIQLHTLLHESGHVAIRENKYFYNSYFLNDNKNKKIDILREEIYAWDQAWKIADSFGIFLIREKFINHRNNSLNDYIKWAAKRKK